jgi:predicted restriction endonuclease
MNLNLNAAPKAAEFLLEAVEACQPEGAISPNRRKWTGATDKKIMGRARLAQARFRSDVKLRWGNRCAVTGCDVQSALRASHILPWQSFPQHRTDPDNGLYLLGTLDALFDRGHISFDDKGRIEVSKAVPKDRWKSLGLSDTMKLRQPPSSGQTRFLRRHHELRFLKL